jgi:hypothetical protein
MTGMKKSTKHNDLSDPEDILDGFIIQKPESEVFKVPEGYFDSLPSRIRDGISAQTQHDLRPSFFRGLMATRKVWIPALAVAIAFIAIYLLVPGQQNAKESLAEINDTLNFRENYDASYAGEVNFDEYAAIYQMIEDKDIEDDLPASFITTSNDGISNDDICDYLQEQDLDTEVLVEL